MDTVKVAIEGTSPLLMHNGQLADPLNEWAKKLKKVTAKRQKTDDDYWEMAQIEFMGSLYFDKKDGVYIPGDNISTMIRDGGTLKKRGAMVKRGVECLDVRCPVVYEGPRTMLALWDLTEFRDTRTIKNGSTGGRVPRTRPKFNEWSLGFTLFYEPGMINLADLRQCVEDAGMYVGLGDYRPGSPKGGRYGRFKLTGWEASNG
jgi:hypothetical protein